MSSQRPRYCVGMYLYICLGHLDSFPGLVLSVLVLSGRRTYGPRLVQILLQFQLRDTLELAFMERVVLDMGAHLDTRKECQATQEPWEMSLHEELPSLDCSSHHLPSRLTFRAYNKPILKT